MRASLIFALAMLASVVLLPGDVPSFAPEEPPLPKIARAPQFTLTSQDGAKVSLADFRGKVVAVTFIYTLCSSTCPVLTPMMSLVQDRLGVDFGKRVAFISITVDPERDTPEVLKLYAESFRDQAHLDAIVAEARRIVDEALDTAQRGLVKITLDSQTFPQTQKIEL